MIPLITPSAGWLDGFVIELIAFAIRATAILGGAWLATSLLRRSSAATRHIIWTSAVAGVLALPVLGAVLPKWNVPVATVAAKTDAPPVATTAPAAQEHGIIERAPYTESQSVPAASVPATPAPAPSPSVWARLDARAMIVGGWVVLAILLLARLAIANARLSTWHRESRLVEDPSWLGLVRRLTRSYGIERPVVLLENAHTDVPVTWGIVYPVIMLPASAADWDEEQRVAVLTHELAHVKRFDALSQLLGQVALALLWFHPLAWMAVRRMRLEREHACDDFVLVAGARASRYADDLLGLARRLSRPTAPAAAALAMARRSELEGRLLAILDPAMKRTTVRRARVALLTAAALLFAMPLAAFRPAVRVTVTEPAASVATVEHPVQSVASRGRGDSAPRTSARHDTTSDWTKLELMLPRIPAARYGQQPALQSPSAQPVPQLSATQVADLKAFLETKADTEPVVQHDIQTLVEITRATKGMTSDYEKGQMLASIAKRYRPDEALRDAYLDVVLSMTSDHERGQALLALLTRDSLPASSAARVLRGALMMSSDHSRSLVLRKISPASFADTVVQRAYLDVLTGMSSNTDRASAIATLVRQRPLTPAVQLGLLRATTVMTSNTEKANVLLLFLDQQGIADDTVRRAFIRAAGTISSDHDYRRVMSAVLK